MTHFHRIHNSLPLAPISLLLLASLILAACTHLVDPAPETIIETVAVAVIKTVEVPGEEVVTTQVVLETVVVTQPPEATEAPAATEEPVATVAPTGAPEPTQAPSIPDQLAAVDQILEKLEFANLAFNAPATLQFGELATIQLLLSPKESGEALKEKITAEGPKESARIRISNQMEARLTGLGFEIQAITPEIQAVSADQITEWKWDIRPTQTGIQQLHLTLSALIYMGDQAMPRTIHTFDQTIEVNVTLSQRISSFFGNNWQWLVTVIFIPIAGWLIRRRRQLTK